MENNELSFHDHVNMLINQMLDHFEDGHVPRYGNFAPLIELFDNPDEQTGNIVGKYGLKLYVMPSGVEPDRSVRYLEAAAYDPSGSYKVDSVVGHGKNEDIIALLESEDFPIRLNRSFGVLLDIMENL